MHLALVHQHPDLGMVIAFPKGPAGLPQGLRLMGLRMIRLIVPAGSGPREFDAVDLYDGCRHRFKPW